ncbi:hypothetical protein AB0M80_31100 [Amycolatopsis sp. NPDC051045]|uniref:SbtR family transcriptional regulator n=1 Tax=Amycolatopsis sp. NPDC051045 TaxID=3156922 RepID=UPI00342ECBAB
MGPSAALAMTPPSAWSTSMPPLAPVRRCSASYCRLRPPKRCAQSGPTFSPQDCEYLNRTHQNNLFKTVATGGPTGQLWTIDHLAHYMMTKRGLADALRVETSVRGELPASAYHAMVGAVSTLLKANADAGTVRDGLSPETVLRGLAGLLYLDPGEDWREQTAALTDLLWCGMGKKP